MCIYYLSSKQDYFDKFVERMRKMDRMIKKSIFFNDEDKVHTYSLNKIMAKKIWIRHKITMIILHQKKKKQ
jgi:hypothetical protein